MPDVMPPFMTMSHFLVAEVLSASDIIASVQTRPFDSVW